MFIYEFLLLARIRPVLTTTYGSINSGARLGRSTTQFLARIFDFSSRFFRPASAKILKFSVFQRLTNAFASPPCPVGYTCISAVFELIR